METNTANLYENNKNKTRVLIISQSAEIAPLIIHCLTQNGNEVDYVSSDGKIQDKGNDFIILEKKEISGSEGFQPNIVLLASEELDASPKALFNNIIGGGILIYSEEDAKLSVTVNECENYFRKIPYRRPEIANDFLKTELGDVPVMLRQDAMKYIEGAKLLCQHLGLMEEDFYEAYLSFKVN